MSSSVVNMVTGLQGAGKTLYTITAVKSQSEREGRQVYYHGIKELKLPWIPLEKPQDWPSVPVGSIVVIDEAQECYRTRAVGTAVPAHVAALETLRHRGITLWLITQHPMLLDSNVRRLCGRHIHAIRRFGGQSSNLHEFNAVRENCDKPGARKDSNLHVFKFPKSTFALYKSAEIHTVKRNIPKKAIFIALLPFAFAAMGWVVYRNFVKEPEARLHAKLGEMPVDGAGSGYGSALAGAPSRVRTPEEYVAAYQPRIAGLDYTAPIYDDLTKPKRVPVPAACVRSKSRCQCYTQQGTRLPVKADQCEQIARDGFFLAFDPDGAEGRPAQAEPSVSSSGKRAPAAMDLRAFPEG